MDLAVIGAVRWIGADDFGFLPSALEIVLLDGAAVAERSEGEGPRDVVFRVRCGDCDHVAEFVERDLLFHRVGEFTADLRAGEIPLHLHGAEIFNDLFFRVDQFGLFVAEIETVAQTEASDAVFAVEGRDCDLFAEGEFGNHDRGVNIVRPIENAGAMREGQ